MCEICKLAALRQAQSGRTVGAAADVAAGRAGGRFRGARNAAAAFGSASHGATDSVDCRTSPAHQRTSPAHPRTSPAAMPGRAEQPGHLSLDRRHANLDFQSWRLSSSILRSAGAVPLPSPAAPPQAGDTDYCSARHAALLNALMAQPRGCYAFLEGQGGQQGPPQLHQVDLGEPGGPPRLRRVCGERRWRRGGGRRPPAPVVGGDLAAADAAD